MDYLNSRNRQKGQSTPVLFETKKRYFIGLQAHASLMGLLMKLRGCTSTKMNESISNFPSMESFVMEHKIHR